MKMRTDIPAIMNKNVLLHLYGILGFPIEISEFGHFGLYRCDYICQTNSYLFSLSSHIIMEDHRQRRAPVEWNFEQLTIDTNFHRLIILISNLLNLGVYTKSFLDGDVIGHTLCFI